MSFIKKFNKEIRSLRKEDAFQFVLECAENGEFPIEQLGVYNFYVAENFEDYELARKIERQFHKSFPDNYRLRYLSAGVAIALEKFDEAIEHLSKLIEYEEKQSDFYFYDVAQLFLAYAFRAQGDIGRMQAALSKIRDSSARTFSVGKVPDLTLDDFKDID